MLPTALHSEADLRRSAQTHYSLPESYGRDAWDAPSTTLSPEKIRIRFWGDLKKLDLRGVKKNSQTEAGGKPVFVWVACPATRDVSRLPGMRVERTLVWDEFAYLFAAERKKSQKPVKTYRNPLFLAREWAEAMKKGKFRSQSAFARTIGVSHARVSQVLGLLRLSPDAREALSALGDPLYSRKVTERKLRPIVNLPEDKQKIGLREML